MTAMSDAAGDIAWVEDSAVHRARIVSARGGPAPNRAVAAGDETTADAALRLVSQGTALVWSGDYHNARQMLQALGRRIDRRRRPLPPTIRRPPSTPTGRHRRSAPTCSGCCWCRCATARCRCGGPPT